MTEYHVVWRIEIEADSPTEAAAQARQIMLDPDSEATVYEVTTFQEWREHEHRADFLTIDVEEQA